MVNSGTSPVPPHRLHTGSGASIGYYMTIPFGANFVAMTNKSGTHLRSWAVVAEIMTGSEYEP